MNKRSKLATLAVTAVAVAGLGGGIAFAQSSSARTTRPAATVEPTTPDTDNVQEGDQTTPDAPAAAQATVAKATVAKATVARPAARAVTKSSSETSGEDSESSSETEAPSDGPGGHADPAGDVQHEGGDSEQ